MSKVPKPLAAAMLNRLQAALADVPAGQRAHFSKIGRVLHLTTAQVTFGVWQLVDAGRLDKFTLRPPRRERQRPYCRFPDDCAAKTRGPCTNRCTDVPGINYEPVRLPMRANGAAIDVRLLDPPPPPRLSEQPQLARPPLQFHDLVWCAQCDRRVPVGKAAACQSPFCKVELPAHLKECKL